MEVFREIGVVDYPTRGIANIDGVWRVCDVVTGKLLTSFPARGARSYIVAILDGDHFLTDWCEVVSIPEGRVIQEVPDLRSLLRGKVKDTHFADGLKRNVVRLPAAKRNAYALNTSYREGVFDPRRVTQKLAAYHHIEYPTGDTVGFWNWDGKTLEKDHEVVKFDSAIINNVVGIYNEQNPWMIAIHLDEEVIVYDTLNREQLFKFATEDQDQIFPLPSGELGALIHTEWGAFLKRYSGPDGIASSPRSEVNSLSAHELQEVVSIGWSSMDLCILTDKENSGHYLIEMDNHKLLRTADPKKILDIKIDGKVLSSPLGPKGSERPSETQTAGRFSLSSYLHGNDVVAVRRRKERTRAKTGESEEEKENVVIFDLLTGEIRRKFTLPDVRADVLYLPVSVNSSGEPVERFLVGTQETKFPFKNKTGKYLLEFTSAASGERGGIPFKSDPRVRFEDPSGRATRSDTSTDGYKLGEKREVTNLLPISREQRKIMAEGLISLFPETSIPKEVIGVVAGFV